MTFKPKQKNLQGRVEICHAANKEKSLGTSKLIGVMRVAVSTGEAQVRRGGIYKSKCETRADHGDASMAEQRVWKDVRL